MEALETRWAAAHAATLPLVRALATSEPPPAAAAASRLPPGTLDGATLAFALAREAAERGIPTNSLAEHLDELEAILDEMHALARTQGATVAALDLDAAAWRGDGGVRLSPADRAMVASAPLRCYEAELALKRWIAEALQSRVPPPPDQVQSLLVAWTCQPMIEPVDAMKAGYAEQLERERTMDLTAGVSELTVSDRS